MNNSKFFLAALCFWALVSPAPALPPAPFVVEPPPNAAYPDYGPGNQAAARLRKAPARMFTFDRAALRDVLRYLADDAGIPYIGIPESNSANSRLITFTMEASPFLALESVCRDNGVRLTYENGVWYMRTVDEERERRLREEDENKLIGVAYRLQYDPVDRVDFRDDTQQAANATSGSTTAIANPDLPLQNSQKVFTSRAPRIVNEIRVMLGLPPISFNPDGTIQGEAPASGSNVASTVESATTGSPMVGAAAAAAPERLNPTYVPPQMPQVIYNTDTNLLWVVATRQQHKWVADYLMQVDQPQDLIAIEVKFFETTKDPLKELGINWAGTMQGGYTVEARDILVSPAGNITLNSSADTTTTNPTGTAKNVDFTGNRITTLSAAAPYSAVLTAGDVAFAIQAFMSDDKTSLVQYPRVLTINNREVAITTAENTPINTGVSTVQSGGSSSTPVGTLGYIPVGTQINILPKTIGKEEVALTVAITISTIVGTPVILDLGTGPNPYPRTSQRIFNSSLQVPSGYTLAVGGLEATDDSKSTNGIPFLQDLPGVGYLFKSSSRQRNKRNLIIFITPTLIANKKATRGISETPEAVVPIRPNDPTPPAFTPDGHLVGGANALNAAFAWFDFQAKWFKQINRENRTDKETIKQLRAVISSVRMVLADIAVMIDNADATRAARLQRDEERAMAILTELNKILAYAQDNVM